jgi:hypothetical protein
MSQPNNQSVQVMIDSYIHFILLLFPYRADWQNVEHRFLKTCEPSCLSYSPGRAVATDILILTDNSKIVLNYFTSYQESPVFNDTGNC